MEIDHQQTDLFLMGNNVQSHQLFGAHLIRDKKGHITHTRFTVYAPHAKEVRLIMSANNYEGWKHVLTRIHPQGIWQIIIPKNLEWTIYKYEIHLERGAVLYKADPYAFFAEERPATASKVYDINFYQWHDNHWQTNKQKPYDKPILIYEMHLGSWRRKYGGFKRYNELADEIVAYILDQGFTHVEFMPVYEHPLDDSWGYQGTGYFAATSRFGTPKDLMYLIDRLHQAGIGVIIDWVLGHICTDAHGLACFDGTYLYEFKDEHLRNNETWGTYNLDFSKGITQSFMLSAMQFWIDYFHVDGFRIDAVSHLFYHKGQEHNGLNQGAIDFMKKASHHLFSRDETLLLMAEDSTSFPKVTMPTYTGGIGFNYKWNMGFMNDVLSYFKLDPIYRKHHHNYITFGLTYVWSEQFVLPFSHDEVVHLKGSLFNKMPGNFEQKMANWRLLMTLWMTHPGKKLLFMGQEFAQITEWDFKGEIDWYLMHEPPHQQANRYFKDLARVYKYHPALYKEDHHPNGFEWLIVDHVDNSVFSYVRRTNDEYIIAVLNMTPNYYESYQVGVPYAGIYEEVLNSNKAIYGGYDQYNDAPLHSIHESRNNQPHYINVKLSGLTAVLFKYKKG